MSTIAYAALSTQRERKPVLENAPATTPTGVTSYIDALAALVPAEVLTLHAAILTFTTKKEANVTVITDTETLSYSFFGCLIMTVIIYVAAKYKTWNSKLDIPRMIVPALAFVGWTMIQRTTAFDAVFPDAPLAPRTAIGIFAAVILGILAAKLAEAGEKSS